MPSSLTLLTDTPFLLTSIVLAQALTEKGDTGVLPVYLRASGREGEPLSLELSNKPFSHLSPTTTSPTTTTGTTIAKVGTSSGAVAEMGGVVGYGCTDSVLVPASSRPLGRQELVAAVGSLGDTPFRLFEEKEQQKEEPNDQQRDASFQQGTQGEGDMYPRVVTTELATNLFVPAKVLSRNCYITSYQQTIASNNGYLTQYFNTSYLHHIFSIPLCHSLLSI